MFFVDGLFFPQELAELDSLSSSLEDDCNEFKSQQIENERKMEELDNLVYDLKAEIKGEKIMAERKKKEKYNSSYWDGFFFHTKFPLLGRE